MILKPFYDKYNLNIIFRNTGLDNFSLTGLFDILDHLKEPKVVSLLIQ